MPFRTPKQWERVAMKARVRAQREADKREGRKPVAPTVLEVLEQLQGGGRSADEIAEALSCDVESTRGVLESSLSSGYVKLVEYPTMPPDTAAPTGYTLTSSGQEVIDEYNSEGLPGT